MQYAQKYNLSETRRAMRNYSERSDSFRACACVVAMVSVFAALVCML